MALVGVVLLMMVLFYDYGGVVLKEVLVLFMVLVIWCGSVVLIGSSCRCWYCSMVLVDRVARGDMVLFCGSGGPGSVVLQTLVLFYEFWWGRFAGDGSALWLS